MVIQPSPQFEQFARVHQSLGHCAAVDELLGKATEEIEQIVAADQGRLRALRKSDERELLQHIAQAGAAVRSAQRVLRSYAATLEVRQW